MIHICSAHGFVNALWTDKQLKQDNYSYLFKGHTKEYGLKLDEVKWSSKPDFRILE